MALLLGLLAVSVNAVMYYSWLAFRVLASDSPQIWRVKDFLGDYVADGLAIAGLVGAIAGNGTPRLLLAFAAVMGWLLWIRLGVL